ncbi:MAG: glycosyltransferase family 87 protein, partial [Terracidiphilus sp.]
MMNGKRTEVAMLNMGNLRRKGLIWVLLCIGAGALWGTVNAVIEGGWIDFRALYASDRCLIHHQNPYNPDNVEREYQSEDGQRPKTTSMTYVSITRNANLPTTYVLVAPIAILPWGPAHILWMLLTGCVFFLANVLMWDIGADYAPRMATFLACVIGFNCLPVFSSGNTAGFAVGFCGIAVWCFLKDRFVWIGVLCLAFSLAFKPHDSGFVWLYFLLAGGAFRKRAVQTAAITAVIGLASILWFTHVAPGWMHDWKANLAVLSAPGGINDPGPNGIQIRDGLTYSFVSMQGAISMFRDDPHFYNILSCAICGVFLFVWAIWTLRTRFSLPGAWLALASV